MSDSSFLIWDYQAIGTHWWIEVLDLAKQIRNQKLETLKDDLVKLMHDFEQKYSRFIADSFISQLNDNKYLENPPKELFELIDWGEELKIQSRGHFDLAVGKILENTGYDKNYSFESTMDDEIDESAGDQPTVVISENAITLREDTRIDLGAIGKGWLIDKISSHLISKNIGSFIINGGGDIFVRSKNPQRVNLESPVSPASGIYIGSLSLNNCALASSSSKLRSWKDKKSNRQFHHLINMNKKSKVEDIIGVFTTAKNATVADAVSTCIFVSPFEIGRKIARKYEAEFMIIYEDGGYKKSVGFAGELY